MSVKVARVLPGLRGVHGSLIRPWQQLGSDSEPLSHRCIGSSLRIFGISSCAIWPHCHTLLSSLRSSFLPDLVIFCLPEFLLIILINRPLYPTASGRVGVWHGTFSASTNEMYDLHVCAHKHQSWKHTRKTMTGEGLLSFSLYQRLFLLPRERPHHNYNSLLAGHFKQHTGVSFFEVLQNPIYYGMQTKLFPNFPLIMIHEYNVRNVHWTAVNPSTSGNPASDKQLTEFFLSKEKLWTLGNGHNCSLRCKNQLMWPEVLDLGCAINHLLIMCKRELNVDAVAVIFINWEEFDGLKFNPKPKEWNLHSFISLLFLLAYLIVELKLS